MPSPKCDIRAHTVEFQRFGDAEGLLRLSDKYIRTVGPTAPAEEAPFTIRQALLEQGMQSLDYRRFARGAAADVTRTAEGFLTDVAPHIRRFVAAPSTEDAGPGLCQIDFVTHALELSQLPLEVLEESRDDLVVTRRIRQPWPPPEVVHDLTPNVLFVWAQPTKEVPHGPHRELLVQALRRSGLVDDPAEAIVEVGDATRGAIAQVLSQGQRFTHVHLLAHGVPSRPPTPSGERIDLTAEPDPSMHVALHGEGGRPDHCSPTDLAKLFEAATTRPEALTIATCHGAEVDPIRTGAALAHLLHRSGIPIVVGSQFALTTTGSDELVRTFLAKLMEGVDPRRALRACRDALRLRKKETYYDRVAVVGYVHLDDGLEERMRKRRFHVALARLKSHSKDADRHRRALQETIVETAQQELTPAQRDEAEAIAKRFAEVRMGLANESASALGKAEREELHGLEGSSLKREAEAAWNLSRVLPEREAAAWLEQSREALGQAADAYRRAAVRSRDHHWTWVQWLALEAVRTGSLADHEEDWYVARAAARDAASHEPDPAMTAAERDALAEQASWGYGSLCELCLLARLAGRGDRIVEGTGYLDELVATCRSRRDDNRDFPIESTLAQLARYSTWWGVDPHWRIPADVVEQARRLHAHLNALRTPP